MYKFSIIAYFNESVTKDIRNIQEMLGNITGSKESLIAWDPHITVGSGLEVEVGQLENFVSQISDFCVSQKPIIIKTKEFSFVDNGSAAKLGFSPYVVYIKPFDCGTLDNITEYFEKELKSRFSSWYDQPWPYNPHITVAYKDLSEDGFNRVKKTLMGQVFEREIIISSISLAVEGEDGKWRPFRTFPLG